MYRDELVYRDLYRANFQLENESDNVMYYAVWTTKDPYADPPKDWMYGMYNGEEVLGANSYKMISVPIFNIKADQLETYFVCVQEKPQNAKIVVAGKACAKLRLYWPLSQLQKLQ